MPRQKSIYTVKEATRMAFETMPDTFNSQHLVQMARSIMARPSCMDGTILRRLRDLRNEDAVHFNYEIIDNDKSIYRKKKYNPVMKGAGAIQKQIEMSA